MDIQELDSYNLFQEIVNVIDVLVDTFSFTNKGIIVKETFIITKNEEVTIFDDKTEDQMKIIVNWLDEKKIELIKSIAECIKLTEENSKKFISENPNIKEEVATRIKELKKTKKRLEDISFDPISFVEFSKVKNLPELTSDYAGISVSETKYFLI